MITRTSKITKDTEKVRQLAMRENPDSTKIYA